MIYEWVVAQDASGAILVRTRGADSFNTWVPRNRMRGEGDRAATRRACTVREACRSLKRSRRHVYRWMKDGTIRPLGKFLGEWLLDPDEVRRLAAMPAGLKKPPRRSQILFPEYPVRRLHPYRDRALVLARMLDQGDRREAAWALKRYPAAEIREFLSLDGPRLLSPKALRFWALYFGMAIPSLAEWRSRGRRWGGVA